MEYKCRFFAWGVCFRFFLGGGGHLRVNWMNIIILCLGSMRSI